ncbi:uncharacterized protein si:ch211-76m11.7 [Labrus bergylta]|uniref:uncharacterized protein si:ch211-76m11.7 n=1 Tax=Labrus bergylta TaxID=56723 RepID=UPI00331397D8
MSHFVIDRKARLRAAPRTLREREIAVSASRLFIHIRWSAGEHGPEDKGSSAPSCRSIGSGSSSKVEFLEARIQWQEKIIKDLEEECKFLREQIMGKEKSSQPKVFTLEDDDENDDGNMDEDDIIPPSSPNISESSDSDVVIQRRKTRWTQPPASATVAVPGKAHVRVKGPAEVISRYKKSLEKLQQSSHHD